MAGAGVQRPVRDVLLVENRQRVNVCAKGDGRRVVLAAADVGDQAGTPREHGGLEPGGLQAQGDPAGGAVLGVSDLRMCVQIPAELDQLGPMVREKRVELACQITLSHPPSPLGTGSVQEHTGSLDCRGRLACRRPGLPYRSGRSFARDCTPAAQHAATVPGHSPGSGRQNAYPSVLLPSWSTHNGHKPV